MDYDYNYNYDASGSDVASAAAGAAFLGAFIVFIFFFIIVCYAVYSFLLSRLFKKAGIPQWIAWVPIYNTWKLLEMGNQQGFWAVLFLLPFVNIISSIFTYIAMYHVGKKLGKEDWFVVLAIFVPLVWLVWLGFDDSKWPKDTKKVPKAKRT